MLRTALRPRWLGLFAVLVAVVVTFGRLGLWQLNVAQDRGRAEAAESAAGRPVAPLQDVVAPHSAFPSDGSGRRVQATGRSAGQGQFLVAPRRLDGESGYWVVSPFVVAATGAMLPVVRGFVTEASTAPAPPEAELVLTGSLAPGESPAAAPGSSPDGSGDYPVRGSIDLAVLVNEWDGELYNAFAFAVEERTETEPGGGPVAAAGLQRVPPPAVTSGLKWRNAAYALQWWIFAAFAAYMWFRMVRDDADRERDEPTGEQA